VLIALSLFAFDGRMALAALVGHPGIRRHRGGQLPGAGQGAGQDHGGENGCVLSGGKRQRISIARAFLKDAPIILLDEATASLDVENETAIQGALSRLIKHKTVLIIAHRMRTVAGADQVVVLSGGIVAEQGSPAELYARKGLYSHMVDLQSASRNWTI
jgi:ATP-binding cassette subfamily B protein IrtB